MGERKAQNKYYPPDFDPSKLSRARRPKNQQMKARMMHPMSIHCNTCGNYIYKGTKFNSRKEVVIGEVQHEIFEPWREEDELTESEKQKRDAEEMGDAMKSLENRTLDSKREMDILAALDEMKSMKEKKLEEKDEALIKSIFHNSKDYVRRIHDEDLDDDGDMIQFSSGNGETSCDQPKRRKVSEELPGNPTDSLARATFADCPTNKENEGGSVTPGDAKLVIKSSTVRISVVKKAAFKDGNSAKLEKKDNNTSKLPVVPEDNNPKHTSTALDSLLQNYESDDD